MRYEPIIIAEPGCEVFIGPHSHPLVGQVLDVRIMAGRQVSYHVVWWEGRTRKAEWLDACEVRPLDGRSKSIAIGFHSPGAEL